MSPASLLAPSQALPQDTPPPKRVLTMTEQPTEISVPTVSRYELELMFSLPHNDSSPPWVDSVRSEPNSSVGVPPDIDAEDEHTLSAYGDISFCEDSIPTPEPVKGASSALQARSPQSRLRLRVRRPPMPKRKLSYAHIAGPLPLSAALERDDRWPVNRNPRTNGSSWYQRQPLVSPLPVELSSAQKRDSGSSLEKLVDGLMPHSPSIRLSPPGSPANRVVSLPLEVKPPPVIQPAHPTPAPLVQQNKQKQGDGGWRTRLPPRPPIPKWDV